MKNHKSQIFKSHAYFIWSKITFGISNSGSHIHTAWRRISCSCIILNFSLSLLICKTAKTSDIMEIIESYHLWKLFMRKTMSYELWNTLFSSISVSLFCCPNKCCRLVMSKTFSRSSSKDDSRSSRRRAGNLSTMGIKRKQLNCKKKGK